MQHPLETANYILILIGVILIGSGPYIVFRTTQSVIARRRQDPNAKFQWFSNTLNYAIAVVFFAAGILFVLNNLKGNPLK